MLISIQYCSACLVVLEKGAAALAPASAAVRALAACLVLQKQLTVQRRTTSSLHARQEWDPVDPTEDAAPFQGFAVTQVLSALIVCERKKLVYGQSVN